MAICKGLHYTLWMQDTLLMKVFRYNFSFILHKEETVISICDILQNITHNENFVYYYFAIFETLAKEWDKLDCWRVDKFMLVSEFCFKYYL